jgi:hypothetical protein
MWYVQIYTYPQELKTIFSLVLHEIMRYEGLVKYDVDEMANFPIVNPVSYTFP